MASIDDSDESLMVAVKEGSHQAFSILVRRHTPRFFQMAYRLCGRVQEAEDMVQEAFLKIWKNPMVWKDDKGAKFTTWFYRILFNQNIDRARSKKPVAVDDEYLQSFADDKNTPEMAVFVSEEQKIIEAALNSLPERQKVAITLCFYEGVSNSQAAEIMGVNVKALESLLMRAKMGLRDFIKGHDASVFDGKGVLHGRSR